MKIPQWLKAYMSEGDADRVAEAVHRAEKLTTGGIVPIIVHRSSTVGHIPLTITLLLTSLLLALELPVGSDWHFSGLLYWPLVLIFVFALGGFLAQIDILERWLTPKEDQQAQVFQRAQIEFFRARLAHTHASTGILLFLSIAEHRAVVLADKGIAEKLPPETWQGVVDTMAASIRSRKMTEGLIEAIERCGKILAQNFPAQGDNPNELPNTLIVKE